MSRKAIFYRSFQVTVTILLFIFLMACSYYPAIKPLNNEPQATPNEIEEGTGPTASPDPDLSIDFEAEPIITDMEPTPLEQNKDDKEKKHIALTFDDGPDLKYTPQILDILKEKEVSATFFVVGIQVKKYPEVLQRIVEEGHCIGNHSYSHRNFTKLTLQEIIEEIEQTDKLISSAVGFFPTMVRVPYGAINDEIKEMLEEQGRENVLWNIDPRDWAGSSVDEMFDNIISNARDGGNILLHSFGGKQISNTVTLLPLIIDELSEQGYTFVTVEQLS